MRKWKNNIDFGLKELDTDYSLERSYFSLKGDVFRERDAICFLWYPVVLCVFWSDVCSNSFCFWKSSHKMNRAGINVLNKQFKKCRHFLPFSEIFSIFTHVLNHFWTLVSLRRDVSRFQTAEVQTLKIAEPLVPFWLRVNFFPKLQRSVINKKKEAEHTNMPLVAANDRNKSLLLWRP